MPLWTDCDVGVIRAPSGWLQELLQGLPAYQLDNPAEDIGGKASGLELEIRAMCGDIDMHLSCHSEYGVQAIRVVQLQIQSLQFITALMRRWLQPCPFTKVSITKPGKPG